MQANIPPTRRGRRAGRAWFTGLALCLAVWSATALDAELYRPSVDLGALFHEVQTQAVFPDSKTFVDYRPAAPAAEIVRRYDGARARPDFDLAGFVADSFLPPVERAPRSLASQPEDMLAHLTTHWDSLTRQADSVAGTTSLIPLPHPYVVPGGRFREIYYWDSYFTMLGLARSGRVDLVENMLDNFAYLIDTLGFIPNGNRTYYLGRSQPPFFGAMVSRYAELTSVEQAARFLPAMEREYAFWMRGRDGLSPGTPRRGRVVRLANGDVLNRYYDAFDAPRPEAYKEDRALAASLAPADRPRMYRDLRAAAESGWDFSTRWFEDGRTFAAIVTTDIVPVDLNALLYHLERTLSRLFAASGNEVRASRYADLAERRAAAINRHLWDEETGTYRDLNVARGAFTPVLSLATVYPLYFGLADPQRATRVADRLESDFLAPGGFVATLNASGQQWDYPNGWPPLQWLTVRGLLDYGFEDLALTGARRWLTLNEQVYRRTGKMMEKYDVVDLSLEAGGGEYPTQDGFGWTNGVALKLAAVLEDVEGRGTEAADTRKPRLPDHLSERMAVPDRGRPRPLVDPVGSPVSLP